MGSTSGSNSIFGATDMAKAKKKKGVCDYCGKNHGDGAPWWNAGKDAWSITVGKNRSRIMRRGWESHQQVMDDWHANQLPAAKKRVQELGAGAGDGEQITVTQICDRYLELLHKTASLKTYEDCKAMFRDLCYHEEFGIG